MCLNSHLGTRVSCGSSNDPTFRRTGKVFALPLLDLLTRVRRCPPFLVLVLLSVTSKENKASELSDLFLQGIEPHNPVDVYVSALLGNHNDTFIRERSCTKVACT